MGICRVKALISAPLPQLWDFLIRPENMHLWGPLTQPITGFDRPLQAGDRVTQSRNDFFRHYSQVLLVEEVIPYRSLRFRDLSPGGLKIDARATIRVEAAEDQDATWIEEAISYSLGSSWAVQWLDRWLINPVMQLVAAHKTNKAFRRLQTLFVSRSRPVNPPPPPSRGGQK
jgi:ligand-binding SRPBCC domain-containing protein